MSKISLELSDVQYKQLLKLAYIGDWVVDEPENIELNNLIQLIFSKAKETGHEKMIDFDEDLDIFMPSIDFDEEVLDIVEDFEEECFWDHLIYRLADRDVRNEMGVDAEKLDIEEMIDRIDPATEKYIKEFEENGLENLYIKS